MKKTLLIASLLAIILSACHADTPAEKARDLEAEQKKLEYENQNGYMKATHKAIFREEALFQDNCKVGSMQWLDEDGRRDHMRAVVCDGLPTTSLQYSIPSGKFSRSVSVLHVGEPVDQVAAAKKVLEEDAKRTEAEAKAKALEKLSPGDKKALGL